MGSGGWGVTLKLVGREILSVVKLGGEKWKVGRGGSCRPFFADSYQENWPISTSKVPACSKFLPEFFYQTRTKNSWNYSKNASPPEKGPFRLGGGKIIECRFEQ